MELLLDVSGENYNGSYKFKNNIDSNNEKLNMTNTYNPLEDLELDITIEGNDGGEVLQVLFQVAVEVQAGGGGGGTGGSGGGTEVGGGGGGGEDIIQ